MEGFYNYDKSLRGKVRSRVAAKVRGTLYHQTLKGYPAMTPGAIAESAPRGRVMLGEAWVKGELLELEDFDRIVEISDEIEGFLGEGHKDNEYDRRLTEVEFDTGLVTPEFEKTILAWVYWYARPDLGTPANPAELVPSGDWRDFMQAAGRMK
jgi:gamma-glutamylcyclotransferase (GGCT)/AIG2-like uncharacterized protein YtfP